MQECDMCGEPFNPERTNWLCPWCHWHNSCCEGAPCPVKT